MLASRQKLQNLVFPSGIYFDKNTHDYRTETENEVFKTFHLFSSSCKDGIEKGDKRNYSLVAFCRGDRIRTCDRLVPNQMRYRAALHPANSFVLSGCKITRFSLRCKRNKFIISSN